MSLYCSGDISMPYLNEPSSYIWSWTCKGRCLQWSFKAEIPNCKRILVEPASRPVQCQLKEDSWPINHWQWNALYHPFSFVCLPPSAYVAARQSFWKQRNQKYWATRKSQGLWAQERAFMTRTSPNWNNKKNSPLQPLLFIEVQCCINSLPPCQQALVNFQPFLSSIRYKNQPFECAEKCNVSKGEHWSKGKVYVSERS